MRAMILAAGLGTRLRPLTNDRPKALVTVAGHTLLEITLARLRSFGVRQVIVNTHHFADMVADYLEANDFFGMQIEVSREEVLLDTGGGLKRAADFFLKNSGGSEEAFLVHNVDVMSTIDLTQMVRVHAETGALATLAVNQRETSRYLLFDEKGQLCGRRAGRGVGQEPGDAEMVRPAAEISALAFTGIHVISPRFLGMMKEEGAFSIITTYLRLAGVGEAIHGFRVDGSYWRDLGRPESVARAASDIEDGIYRIM